MAFTRRASGTLRRAVGARLIIALLGLVGVQVFLDGVQIRDGHLFGQALLVSIFVEVHFYFTEL